MANFNVFDSVNMASTKYAERILDAIATVDVENGTFGYLDGLAEGEDVTYKFVAGIKEGEQVVVADNPAWDEDNSRIVNQRKDKYIIPAGTRFRVRVIRVNDEFGTAIEGVTVASKEKMAKDAFVTIDATTGKLVASDTSTTGAVMEGKVMRVRKMGGTLVTAAHNYGYSRDMYEVKVVTLA